MDDVLLSVCTVALEQSSQLGRRDAQAIRGQDLARFLIGQAGSQIEQAGQRLLCPATAVQTGINQRRASLACRVMTPTLNRCPDLAPECVDPFGASSITNPFRIQGGKAPLVEELLFEVAR